MITIMPPSLLGKPALRDLEKLARSAPPGAFVEIGVYQGGSAAVLYKIALEQGRALYLYDTFEGMPYHHAALDGNKKGAFADTDFDTVRRLFPDACVIKGIFPMSLVNMPSVAFVHADADQYESTKAICQTLPPRMVSGGMILFDDYQDPGCRGCTKAVQEHFKDIEIRPTGKGLVRV